MAEQSCVCFIVNLHANKKLVDLVLGACWCGALSSSSLVTFTYYRVRPLSVLFYFVPQENLRDKDNWRTSWLGIYRVAKNEWPGSVNWVEFSQRSATTQTIPYLLMNHWQIITFTQTSNEWPGWVMREFLPRSRYICPTLLLREISFPPRPHQPLQLHYGPAF